MTAETIHEEPRQPSREIALHLLGLADISTDQMERLVLLQLFSDEVKALGVTVEDMGKPLGDVIAIANRSYGGSAQEMSAIHTIAGDIIASIPTQLTQ